MSNICGNDLCEILSFRQMGLGIVIFRCGGSKLVKPTV